MLYTAAQLLDSHTGFPVDTEANALATIAKLEQLVRDGFLSDPQIDQVLNGYTDGSGTYPGIGGFFDTNAETAPSAPSGVYTGTAGAVSLYYAVILAYPLVPAPGNAGAPSGKYLNFLAGKRPGGRPGLSQLLKNDVHDQRDVFYGPHSASSAAVASTAATLDATHYVTVTLPAYGGIGTGVKYDVIALDASGHPIYWVGRGAPGGTVVDSGKSDYQATSAQNDGKYWPAHSEVAVGPTSSALIYGSTVTTREAGF